MAKKPTKKADAETVAVQGIAAQVSAPTPAPLFTPCRQCGNPGDCARAAKCSKGFK